MRRILLATTAITLALGSASLAADLKPLRKVPPPAAPPSWAGVYIGAFAGGHWSTDRWQSDEMNPAADLRPFDLNSSGFTGGGIIGANVQQGNWVWGVEADIGLLSGSAILGPGLRTLFPGPVPNSADADSFKSEVRWNAHARLRWGHSFGQWMPFVAAGVAYADTRVTIVNPPNVAFSPRSISLDRVGFTLGGGVDWMISPNWIARAEYLHDWYGVASFQVPTNFDSQHMEMRSNIVRGALLYKFGDAPLGVSPALVTKAPSAGSSAAAWAGLYMGLFAGGHESKDRYTSAEQAPIAQFGPINVGVDSFTGGVLIGANVQHGNFVWGTEADVGILSGSGTFGFAPLATGSIETEAKWNAHARVRFGYAMGNVMPYIAAGAAFAKTNVTLADPTVAPGPTSATIGLDRIGFTFGGGIDWIFNPNLIARVEYLHDRYTTASFGLGITGGDAFHAQLHSNIIRGALIYKSGDGAAGGAGYGPASYAGPWSGAYVGGFAGGHWSTDRWTSEGTTPARFNGPFDFDMDGFTGGVLWGANFQRGNWVWGVEADVGALSGSHTFAPLLNTTIQSIGTELNWNAHGRLRFGYAMSNWLPFVAAGIAYANTKSAIVDFPNPPLPSSGTTKLNRIGYTMGVGLDWMFASNWIGRVEYLHDRYATAAYHISLESEDNSQYKELRSNIVRGALIYKFGGPVSAKY